MKTFESRDLTTLKEKEIFTQQFLGTDALIKAIQYCMGSVVIGDYSGNYMQISSKKFMRHLNESLMVSKRETYTSIEEFMQEYNYQRSLDHREILEELPLPMVNVILREKVYKKIKKQYPEMIEFIISGNEVAIMVPNELNRGLTIIQDSVEKFVNKKIKSKSL